MGLRPSMKLLRVVKTTLVCSLVVVLSLDLGIAQNISGSSVAAPSTIAVTQGLHGLQPVRAFPSIPLWSSHVLTYLGVFSPDATFHTTSKFTGTTGSSPGEGILPKDYQAHGQPYSAAPARVAELRNRFVTYAYGRPSVLSVPTHVATDSRQRLIVSDPLGDAVHVLDPAGKTSFRIVTGKGYRLHQPAGVAVDASDNIYVADSERGMVAVFDRSGNFQRYIGNFKGENEYQSPDGIAIDRKAGRLYLVDSPRSLVFVLDLSGNVLHRLGRYHDGTGEGKFDDPIDVAFDHNHVYVLDNSGTRVQILDSKGAFLSSFNLPLGFGPQVARDNGLCVDQQGYIYVSFASLATIRVYSHDGRPLASFGQIGKRAGEFAKPEGLWIDSSNRIYVADSGNGRIQLFQLDAQK